MILPRYCIFFDTTQTTTKADRSFLILKWMILGLTIIYKTNSLTFENILFLMIIACVLLLVIGLISPKASLFWYKEEPTRKKSAQLYGLLLITFIIILGLLVTA